MPSLETVRDMRSNPARYGGTQAKPLDTSDSRLWAMALRGARRMREDAVRRDADPMRMAGKGCAGHPLDRTPRASDGLAPSR